MMIKICGLRSIEHAIAAADAGADMLGFIFAPSRRQVTPELVAAVRAALDRRGPRPALVGVFVNAPAAEMAEVADRCGLDWLQLSGDEDIAIRESLGGRRLLKTVRLSGADAERGWLEAAPRETTRLHVDAHVPGVYGGAGVLADWGRAALLAQRAPVLLAGGLTPDTVAEAIRQVRPWGVDVSSGVETDGVKDPGRIRAFIAAARAAFAQEQALT